MKKADAFVLGGIDHVVGDEYCPACWDNDEFWPRLCDCGGLVHAESGDVSWDGEVLPVKACDRCGDDYACDE